MTYVTYAHTHELIAIKIVTERERTPEERRMKTTQNFKQVDKCHVITRIHPLSLSLVLYFPLFRSVFRQRENQILSSVGGYSTDPPYSAMAFLCQKFVLHRMHGNALCTHICKYSQAHSLWPIKKGQMELWRLYTWNCCCYPSRGLCTYSVCVHAMYSSYRTTTAMQSNNAKISEMWAVAELAAESEMWIYVRTNHCWSPSFDFRYVCVFALWRFNAHFCAFISIQARSRMRVIYRKWNLVGWLSATHSYMCGSVCNCFVCPFHFHCCCSRWLALCYASFCHPATGCRANLP